MEEEGADKPAPHQEVTLGDLGLLCLTTESVFEPIVLNVFGALTWSDTTLCLKCTRLATPLLKELMQQGKMTPEAAQAFYSSILMGLQMHGQHDLSQPLILALGVQAYDILRPTFNSIAQMMLSIPSCSEKALANYDQKFLAQTQTKTAKGAEKKKKEAFKKLVESVIAVNVSEQFQRKAIYRPVGMLFRQRKKQSLPEDTKDLGLCSLFKPEDANNGQCENGDITNGQAMGGLRS